MESQKTAGMRKQQEWMQEAAKWEVWEAVFLIEGAFENPFFEVELQAQLQCREQSFLIDGFYDGERAGALADETSRKRLHVWKLRFSPREEGEWSFQTISNCRALNGISGTFLCTRALSRGGLTVNPKFPNWFSREDGSPQMVVNDGWFPHAANGHWVSYEEVDYPQPSEQELKEFLELLAEYGVNLVIDMTQLYARQTRITDPSFAWPWKVTDPEHNRVDKDRFQLEFYRRWERILEYCAKKELFFAVELLFDNSVVRQLEWSHHPMNVENGGWLMGDSHGLGWSVMFDLTNEEHKRYTARYLRYTIARLSAYRSVLWELGGENANLSQLPDWMLPHGSLPDEKVASWYNYWGAFVKQWDPCKRLCTYGDTTYQKDMVCGPGNDWVLTQDPRNYSRNDLRAYYRTMSRYGAWYWQYRRPMVVGEMNSFNNGNYGRERRFYWTAMVSGYLMGRSDRHFALLQGQELAESRKFGPFSEHSHTGKQVPPIYGWLKLLRSFVEREVSYWRMHPANERISASREDLLFCLAEEEREYLLYLPFGGEGRLQLEEEGCYRATWLNPRTGERQERCVEAVRNLDERREGDWSRRVQEGELSGQLSDSLQPFAAAEKEPVQTAWYLSIAAADDQDWVLHLLREEE